MAGSIFRNRSKCKIPGLYEYFAVEFRHRKKPLRNEWITQGIKMSSRKRDF